MPSHRSKKVPTIRGIPRDPVASAAQPLARRATRIHCAPADGATGPPLGEERYETLKRHEKAFASAVCRRSECEARELLCRGNDVEQGPNAANLFASKINDVNAGEGGAAPGRSEPRRSKNTSVSGGDPPRNNAPTPVGSGAKRRLDCVLEIGEGRENSVCKLLDGIAAPGGRMKHAEVVPLNVGSQHGDKTADVAVVPGREEGVHRCDRIGCHEVDSNGTPYAGAAVVWYPASLVGRVA